MRLDPEHPLAEAPRGKKRRTLTLALRVLFLLAWSGLLFGAGFAYQNFVMPSLRSLTGATQLSEIVASLGDAPQRWLRARLDPVEVPRLRLDIKFKYLHQIHQKREEALAQGLLVTADDDFVPAEIRHGERSVPVEVRLKGDLPDHLLGDKWSFRVKTRDGQALLGMRRFSLQAPRTRGYQAEPLFLESLRWLGVLAPRYFFVEFEVNGRDIGLMALEEHFHKVLLESQGRRESVILKFDESIFWQNQLHAGHHLPFDDYRKAPIEAFGMGAIRRSPVLVRDLAAARGLLRGFTEGKLSASEVFDEALLGRYLAACEVWAAQHPCRWHNLRFYFNPIDRELEPVGFDGNLHLSWLSPALLTAQEPITREFLRDPAVREAFVRGIRELAEGLDDGELLPRLQRLQGDDLAILHREFPARSALDLGVVRARASALSGLDPAALFDASLPSHAERRYPSAVLANVIRGQQGPELQLASALPYSVRVEAVRLQRESSAQTTGFSELLAGFPIDLPATREGAAPVWHRVALPVTAEIEALLVTGEARVEGQLHTHSFTARPSHPAATAPALPHVRPAELLARHSFLRASRDPGFLEILPGSWPIEDPLWLPAGMGLRIGPGTQLRFAPGGLLVVRGPTEFSGSKAQPILLEPLLGEEPWPGVLVLNAGAESRWSHVHVRQTRGFTLGEWQLTGAVTFYQSDVAMAHCRFQENSGEDALNIIRSRFLLEEITVVDAASDGFDGDFTRGEIRGGRFARIGGDGIDVSASNVSVSGTRLEEIRDKAISVGEGSHLVATGLRIDKVGSAVVSKDDSEAAIRDSTIQNVEHAAFMAYVKKPEFSPARLTVENVSVTSTGQLAIAQWGSDLVIDGVPQPGQDFDAEAVYESGYMKK